MAIIKTDNSHYTNIANAIRSKSGTKTQFKPSEMPQGVESVFTAGYEKGKAEVIPAKAEQEKLVTITENGTTEVLPDDGKVLSKVTVNVAVTNNGIYDEYQYNGERTDYDYGFAGEGWNDAIFNPQYDIICTSSYFAFKKSRITNLKGILDKNNVILDTSNSVDVRDLFNSSKVTHIGVVSTASVLYNWCGALFCNCKDLISVEELYLSECLVAGTYNQMFLNCSNLVSIKISGVILWSISFSHSLNLNAESAKSALIALKNYAGTENKFAYKITFHSNVWNLLDAEGETAPDGVTWRDYAYNKGWNI